VSTWRRMLKTTYNCNDYGKFLIKKDPISKTEDWIWFLYNASDRIYQKHTDRWEERSRLVTGRRTRQNIFGDPTTVRETTN
jgi:hypothetical protein